MNTCFRVFQGVNKLLVYESFSYTTRDGNLHYIEVSILPAYDPNDHHDYNLYNKQINHEQLDDIMHKLW